MTLSPKKFSSESSDIVDLKLGLAKFWGTCPRGASARGFSLEIKPMKLGLIEI